MSDKFKCEFAKQRKAEMLAQGAFETEDFGFACDCAGQYGASYLDDDATVFQISAEDLFVLMDVLGYREAPPRVHWEAQATQAEVTGEREAFESCALMEGSLFKRRADDPDKYWDGNVQDDWELWQARAILSLRPERVPMTDLPEGDVTYFDGRGDAVDGYTAERVWEILRSCGIAAPAKKEGA